MIFHHQINHTLNLSLEACLAYFLLENVFFFEFHRWVNKSIWKSLIFDYYYYYFFLLHKNEDFQSRNLNNVTYHIHLAESLFSILAKNLILKWMLLILNFFNMYEIVNNCVLERLNIWNQEDNAVGFCSSTHSINQPYCSLTIKCCTPLILTLYV